MKKPLFIFVVFLVISLLALLSTLPDGKLHIYICDVGQGDGILIEKGQTQIIVDGGPDNSIETCLGTHMPFWDRTIEVALMTHADSDHYFGFIEMAKRYKINEFIGSSVDNDTKQYEELKNVIKEKQIKVISVHAGEQIKIGELSFNIIFPTEDFLTQKTKEGDTSSVLGSRTGGERNDFCAIGFLTYGNFTGLFTCDTSPMSEDKMLSLGIVPHAYFLKVSHHGSKNGLTESFLKAVNPSLAAISVGQKNRYGHPSPEIIKLLENFGVKTLRTDVNGEIEISTDGKKVWTN